VLCHVVLSVYAGNVMDRIKHVLVLMLENRSFDHMLGLLKRLNPEVNGCLPNDAGCSNTVDPLDPTSASYTVGENAVYVQVDPHHSIKWTTEQIYGYPVGTTPPEGAAPSMNGFISSYIDAFSGDVAGGATIMQCFAPEHVPIMSNLSMEYGFFDGWHASVPGPTMVNRAYAASATSNGMGTNDAVTIAKGLPQKTMFRQLEEMGLDYAVYFQDVPSLLQFKDMRHRDARPRYHVLSKLSEDLASGNIPQFTWIEPAYFNGPLQDASDQHPDHDVGLGEKLIKNVYEAIRASPIWNETLFIITYDEHGGFFDHVSPMENIPSPDGINSTDDPFDFTRLGVRIPTVMISPWIEKGSVFHAPRNQNAGQYEHSSIISTVVHKIFQPTENHPRPRYLTARDEWAKTFEWVVEGIPQMRTDCPMTLPDVVLHQEKYPGALPPQDGSLPVSSLQKDLISLMAGVTDQQIDMADVAKWTESQGLDFVLDARKKHFGV